MRTILSLSFVAVLACFAVAPNVALAAQGGHMVSGSPTAMSGGSVLDNAPFALEGTPVNFDEFPRWRGTDSRLNRGATFVVKDNDEWVNLWRRSLSGNPPEPLPVGTMAIAIVLGPRPTAGYYPGLVDIRTSDEITRVSYVENKPIRPPRERAQGGVPWLVQLLPLTDGRVRFFSLTPMK